MAESDSRPGAAGPEPAWEGRRDELASAIFEGLALIVRRFRAQSAKLHPKLSLTSYTLLLHLHETGGSRASELVAYYGLNKSTVSRQLADLTASGLVERELDQTDSRVQIVRISEAGRQVLAEVREILQRQMLARLEGWPDAELAEFARLLRRYNIRPGHRLDTGALVVPCPAEQDLPEQGLPDQDPPGQSPPERAALEPAAPEQTAPGRAASEHPEDPEHPTSQPAGVTTWT